ncbi:Hypothetical predicted protein, partial [Paramuricea clavata]
RIKGMPDEIVEPDDYANKSTCDERFRYLTTRLKHFWKRWRREYLVNLREYHKLRADDHGVAKVNVGDVVTVFEEDVKRNKWKLGVVEGLIKGKDVVVRGAKLRVITSGAAAKMSRAYERLIMMQISIEGKQSNVWNNGSQRNLSASLIACV